MLIIVLNSIINNKKMSKNNKNIKFSFNYKNNSKKNVSLIIIKILINFEAIINFIFQLLIKELGNSENESNEH